MAFSMVRCVVPNFQPGLSLPFLALKSAYLSIAFLPPVALPADTSAYDAAQSRTNLIAFVCLAKPMSTPQQSKRKGRRSGGQQSAPWATHDGVSGSARPAGPGAPQDIKGKGPEIPSRTENCAKDMTTARDLCGATESAVGGSEDGAGPSGRPRNLTIPTVSDLKPSEPGEIGYCVHLDDDKLWQAIRKSTSLQPAAMRNLEQVVHGKSTDLQDYQLLLEAVRCEILKQPRLRDTCLRLYLVVKTYGTLSQGLNAGVFGVYFNKSSQKVEQEVEKLANQLQRMSLRRVLGEGVAEMPLSVSQTSWKGNNKLGRPKSSHGTTQNPASKELNKRHYTIRKSWFFSLGRVFTMLWHDNETAATRPAGDTGCVTPGPYDQNIYSQIRRFAVVKQGHGFSWAIPVNTYHEQGTTRYKLTDEDHIQAHAIIYMKGTVPQLLPGETTLKKQPIMVNPSAKDIKLHHTSRIRFDKVFTIEHNVIVRDVGKISEDSMPFFSEYWKMQALEGLEGTKASVGL
ncbi:hypothetical protein AYO21_03999 [Fonsecaea monophora]|uniref:DUF6590 domain-containing protein n=1 Tax=Fonsecaea monophora TaxID=254056 RepID=A0A177FBX5_9EURO|nr:hypothetical protein AYO21_03999 [Fonsecaea monophora]OAG41764.1 hypothetical protein AYO21_03999 [Fonsecaea monophora]